MNSPSPSGPPASRNPPLPIVVQLGFAGCRNLFDPVRPPADPDAYRATIREHLQKLLVDLPTELHLEPWHFFCGISQIAIGGDTLFTEACAAVPIVQRIVLPQPVDCYLTAVGSEGPDFSPREQLYARELLAEPHLAHVRVVSSNNDRHTAFGEVNLELARISDVCVCLVRKDATGKPGGTLDLVDCAKRRRRPTLLIEIEDQGGTPVFTETRFHWPPPDKAAPGWKPPVFPQALNEAIESAKTKQISPGAAGQPSSPGVSRCRVLDWWRRFAGATAQPSSPGVSPAPLPSAPVGVPMHSGEYLDRLKTVGSSVAESRKVIFKWAALIIIGTHVVATFLALLGLGFHGAAILPTLLILELLLLGAGLAVHYGLHHAEAAQIWAISRLTAEFSASGKALLGCHVYLEHFFSLPFPPTLRPLLRTINVLHLASSPASSKTWTTRRNQYLASRFVVRDQLAFYRTNFPKKQRRLEVATRVFYTCASLAWISTAAKLVLVAFAAAHSLDWIAIFGMAAIFFPVVAVGALSLAASFDLEALVNTYRDTLGFLDPDAVRKVLQATGRKSHAPGPALPAIGLVELLRSAQSELEFHRLALETETILLGETANWASRRSFLPVT